jgi:transcriptional regulator with XRE-family HTH domain
MPGQTIEALMAATAEEVREHHYNSLKSLEIFIDKASAMHCANHAGVFSFVIAQLLEAGCEQKQLANLLGVSRASTSRWAKGIKLPPQPMYRESVVNALAKHLKEIIASLRPPEPDPVSDAISSEASPLSELGSFARRAAHV